jgi:predicted component of type VI protein secretion system
MDHLETDVALDNAALTLHVLSDLFPLAICFGVESLVTLLEGRRFLTKVSGHLVEKKKHRGALQVARNILGTRISVQ